MSVSNTTNRVGYAGDGSSAVFSFPYYFFAQADIKVFTYNTVLGSVRQETLNSTFTVSGTANAQGLYTSGANIVYASSPGVTDIVVIFRDPSQVQNYALLQNGTISSAAIVQQFDYLTLLVQRIQDESIRALRLPDGIGSSAFSGLLPNNICLAPNQYLVTNSNATAVGFASNLGGFGPNGYALIGNGSSAIATYQPFLLSGSSVSGTLTLSNGGTGGLVPQTWGVVYASSASQLATTNPGPVGYVLTANASSAPSFQQVSLNTSEITGNLPTTNGGTGVAGPYTQYGMIYASSATQFGTVPSATAGFLLTANGSSAPSFQVLNAASLTGIVLLANGGTGSAMGAMTPFGVVFASSASQMASSGAGGGDQPLVGNAGAAPSFKALPLASGSSVSGVLGITNGGTGSVLTISQYGVVFASSTTQMAGTAPGGTNQPLVGNTGAAPSYQALNIANGSSVSGILGVTNGGTGTGVAYTAKGLIFASSTTQFASFPQPASDNLVLQYNSSTATGYQWGAVLSSPLTTKGDIISTSNGSSAVRVGVGTLGQFLTANSSASTGILWSNPSLPTITILTSGASQTYSVPALCKWLEVELTGGGGGGGAVDTLSAQAAAAGGGGGGGYSKKIITGSLAASYTYTIGDGGTGGAAGPNSGNIGGNTIFGSSVLSAAIIGNGGAAGGGSSTAAAPVFAGSGGDGGAASGGDLNVQGGGGGTGIILSGTQATPGVGGANPLAGNTPTNNNASAVGTAGRSYGGGAGGAVQVNNGGTKAGAKAAGGVVKIREHYV